VHHGVGVLQDAGDGGCKPGKRENGGADVSAAGNRAGLGEVDVIEVG